MVLRNSRHSFDESLPLEPDRQDEGSNQPTLTENFFTTRWQQTIERWIQVPARDQHPFRSEEHDWILIRQDSHEHDPDAQPDPGSSHTNLYSQANLEQEILSDNRSTAFHTASSKRTRTFYSAPDAVSIATNGSIRITPRPTLSVDNEYLARARRIGIIKPRAQELDWSGIGHHVQFTNASELPLQPLFEIARSARAIVDAVQCRRIRLARKRMLCHRRFKPEEALAEVRHIQLLQHRHIVQCIGSYSLGKWIGILTYPIARCNLEEFLRETAALHPYDEIAIFNRKVLVKFFACLSCTVEYIHGEGVKHMDIKPQNILVNMKYAATDPLRKMDVYITDFGISRTVEDMDQSRTDGPTGRTETYCSPEVAKGDLRGRASDIFSLGCVFAEIATVISGRTLEDFRSFRSDDGSSFYLNLPLVYDWVRALRNETRYWDGMWKPALRDTVIGTLSEEQDMRPSASDLRLLLGSNLCCSERQEAIMG